MNKVMMLGRLCKDPEVRYSQSANPIAVAKYSIAVRRQFAKQGETDVDFFNVTAFGKSGEFAEKYFRKGQQVVVVGRLQTHQWEDDSKVKRTSYEIIIEEQHFAENKKSSEEQATTSAHHEEDDDDLPF